MSEKMKPVKAWMLIRCQDSEPDMSLLITRGHARSYKKILQYPKNYRIARVEIRELKPKRP